MKKLNLLILVSLLCAGLAHAQDDANDPELQALIKAYKMIKAQQNSTPTTEEENPKVRYERALIEAAKEGNTSQVRGLLEAGTNPNVEDKDGHTPLYYAVEKNLAMVDMLLYAGADMNYGQEKYAETPLFRSMVVLPNDDSIRLRLLKEKFDPNAFACFPSCRTLLASAVDGKNPKMVETLIKRGADVNKYVGLYTPLSVAVSKKTGSDTTLTELLLKAGADPWRGFWYRGTYMTSLSVPKSYGYKDKVKLIKEAQKATKEQHNKDEKLIKAVKAGNVEQVRKLLAEGANPNAYGDKSAYDGSPWGGHTALVYANNLEVAQLLLDAGADVNALDQGSWTPLMWAWKPKQLEKVKWLIKHGANVNHNLSSNTPLTLAIDGDYYWERVEALLNAGADVNLRDRKGHGPLYYAKLNNNKKVEEELLKRHATLTKKESEELIDAIAEKSRQAQQAQAQAAANNDGESLGKTFLKGLVDTGMSTLQYGVENGKF